MTRKRTKRRRWFIPALREVNTEIDENGESQYGRMSLPIMWFKENHVSQRYKEWMAFKADLHRDWLIDMILGDINEEESAKARQQLAGWWCDWVPARNRKRRRP